VAHAKTAGIADGTFIDRPQGTKPRRQVRMSKESRPTQQPARSRGEAEFTLSGVQQGDRLNGASVYVTSSYTFSNGIAVVAIITSLAGAFPDITGVTVNGVSATRNRWQYNGMIGAAWQ
jgi:hypothetical protein